MEEQVTGGASLFTLTIIQILMGVLLFVALLNGQRDLIVLTFLVLGIVGGARLWARMSPSGLQCRLDVDKRRVFPGEKVTLTISAENAKPLPIWLEIRLPIGDLPFSGERVLSKATGLLWYQRTQFQWELQAERRGIYQIGPLEILTGDLFSFFSRRKRAEMPHPIIVYPRRISLNSFHLPQRDFFGEPRAKSPVQDPVYILGTRDYQPGQPSKYIHWKASARHNRLQDKVFESTVQEKVLLAVNVDSFANQQADEAFERMLEVVAALAVRLDRQGHSVGLIASGTCKGVGLASVPVTRSYNQVSAILEALARLEMESASDLYDLLRRRLAEAWGVSCIYFSHAEDETVFSAKKYFAQRRIPVVFCVSETRPSAVEGHLGLPGKVYSLDSLRTEKAASS